MLSGFFTIGVIIGLGALLAHVRVLDEHAQLLLSRVAFFVASPALLLMMLATADLQRIFAHSLLATVGAIAVSGGCYLALARTVFHRTPADTVIGTFSACYVNAANLGLPIAAYVLGDITWVAPVLLVQVILLQPAGLTVLDVATARASGAPSSLWRNVTLPLRNPMSIATLTGLLLNLLHIRVPTLLAEPLTLVGAMAVPGMLLAFGISLRRGPLPGRGEPPRQTWTIVAFKLLLQPIAAWALGRALGLDAASLLAVTVIAALPTAQNVFVHAIRYGKGEMIARDSIFLTTLGSVPVIVAITALLS